MRKVLGKIKNANAARKYRRKLSIRKSVVGTTERPRLAVTKTNKNLTQAYLHIHRHRHIGRHTDTHIRHTYIRTKGIEHQLIH